MKKGQMGIVYAALTANDNLMREDVEAIDKNVTALKEYGLVLKVVDGLQTIVLGSEIFNGYKRAWLGQPHLMEDLVTIISNYVKNI